MKVVLINIGRKFESEADTLEEAFANLKLENVKGKSVIQVIDGEKVKERVVHPRITMMLSRTSGLARAAILKNLTTMFV